MNQLPESFKPLLWSYDFSACDPLEMKQTIIANTIAYGNLDHWRWIKSFYGASSVRESLANLSATALRPSARRLAEIAFA